jgi:hypothetical protein
MKRTHGHTVPHSLIYYRWANIKACCCRQTHPSYRTNLINGITICERWKNSFENFLEDMGDIPFKGAKIYLVENTKEYNKENCKWTNPPVPKIKIGRGGLNAVDRTGKRYGSLLVIERVSNRVERRATWLCVCDCGNEKILTGHALARGTKSCGCAKITGPRENYTCKLPPGVSALNNLLKSYKRGAKDRHLAWELNIEEFSHLTSQPCYYCGSPPSLYSKISKNGQYLYNGLDRVNNKDGYTTKNVVTCCRTCNHAKACMSKNDFISWILRAAKNLTSPAFISQAGDVSRFTD